MDLIAEAEKLGFTTSSEPIQPGDTYLAGRNTGPHLLICERVVNNVLGEPSYIVPVEMAYCFDVWHCVKIIGE